MPKAILKTHKISAINIFPKDLKLFLTRSRKFLKDKTPGCNPRDDLIIKTVSDKYLNIVEEL